MGYCMDKERVEGYGRDEGNEVGYGRDEGVMWDMIGILTRFNKICHPSQRPRWQVDKEAIGLSRVQQCSSTYNPPS